MRSIGTLPWIELLVCFAASIAWCVIRVRRTGIRASWPKWQPLDSVLFGLLISGLYLRLLDPVKHMALGQSDAYVHLAFLRSLLEQGRLPTETYPPGFYWMMVGPVQLMHWDVYEWARFSGAGWGVLHSLGIYVCATSLRGRHRDGFIALLIGTFFSPWFLVTKTGIGMYPNQAGLLLVLASIDALLQRNLPRFTLLMFALSLTVPMMLLLWIPVILILLWKRSTHVTPKVAWGIRGVVILLGVVAVGVISVKIMQDPALISMVRLMTVSGANLRGKVEGVRYEGNPVWMMVEDFFAVKRFGFGSIPMNLAGLGLLLGHLVAFGMSLKQRDDMMALFWGWGLLTGIATLTGVFNFSAYQRSGWEFLLTSAMLTGVLCGVILDVLPERIPKGMLVLLGGCGLVGWSFLHPPGHVYTGGSEMETMIRFAREIKLDSDEVRKRLNLRPSQDGRLSVCFRRTTSFSAVSSEPFLVVARWQDLNWKGVKVGQPVSFLRNLPPAEWIVLVGPLRDSNAENPLSGAFSSVSPDFAEKYARWNKGFQAVNQELMEMIQWAMEQGIPVRHVALGDGLDAYIVDTSGEFSP